MSTVSLLSRKCGRCRRHGVLNNFTGHQGNCPFYDCTCEKCAFSTRRPRAKKVKAPAQSPVANPNQASCSNTSNNPIVNNIGDDVCVLTSSEPLSSVTDLLQQPSFNPNSGNPFGITTTAQQRSLEGPMNIQCPQIIMIKPIPLSAFDIDPKVIEFSPLQKFLDNQLKWCRENFPEIYYQHIPKGD
ncbi:unnamed protein product [Bursaphelenchus xylophilus]|uniref:(pine wood nematode) hypothetical protein n=1 Tax=Bursaphelenchus xylophilus TaxID=6326 RepID=A0A1I7RIV5_BURXY|nr:unnamed protein product [Bursaphelenchus xylophilus]CAG9119120.1 unnamed protein product [Bursaphelenchus xylophilus]